MLRAIEVGGDGDEVIVGRRRDIALQLIGRLQVKVFYQAKGMIQVLLQRYLQCAILRVADGEKHLVGTEIRVYAGEGGSGRLREARPIRSTTSEACGKPSQGRISGIESSRKWSSVSRKLGRRKGRESSAICDGTVNCTRRIAAGTIGELLRHGNRDGVLRRRQVEEARIAHVVGINRKQRVGLDVTQIIHRKYHPRAYLMLQASIDLQRARADVVRR